ncbi:MAG TPA: aldehyde dehydrogenase family protein [Magnetospirillaceae bacterium]|jgi:phenylacetaldehyde dehydrogenase
MGKLDNDLSRLGRSTRAFLDKGGMHFIDGALTKPGSGQALDVRDPSSGKVISSLSAGTASDIDQAVTAAKRALSALAWHGLSPADRERLITRLADLCEANIDQLAELEIVDNGMPAGFARNLNVAGAIGVLRYMAGWPTKIAGRTISMGMPIPGSAFFAATVKEPVGVVGAITPWNVPLMSAIWKIAPALAAGCTVVLKPSEEACLSVLRLAELIAEAGFPPGVVNIVTGTGPEAGEALVRHPDVSKISFTGSNPVGRRIGALATGDLKKVTLELGGKSPNVVFADADLDRAADAAAQLIFMNSGQVCVAGSRLYVQRAAYDQVVDRVVARAKSLRIGPGLAADTELGPLVSAKQQSRVLGYVDEAKAQGATLLTDNPRLEADGYYVRPTVVAGTRADMRIVQEEVFGPVLAVMPFDDMEEAITLANQTVYGLAATIWTRDLKKAHTMLPRITCGYVAVNSDAIPYPGLPHGGRKQSGIGRDLGEEAVEGCLEVKSYLVRYD